jgi:hypothetical protein
VRRNAAVFLVAVVACAQQHHSGQSDPTAHRVYDHRTGKIMELFARSGLDPGLNAVGLVPGNTFKKRVHKADDDGRSDELRPKLGALGNAARDDGGDGGGKGEQEEKLHQLVAVLGGQRLSADKKAGAVGDAVAHRKVHDGGDREVDQNFDQSVDLVLFADGTEF